MARSLNNGPKLICWAFSDNLAFFPIHEKEELFEEVSKAITEIHHLMVKLQIKLLILLLLNFVTTRGVIRSQRNVRPTGR